MIEREQTSWKTIEKNFINITKLKRIKILTFCAQITQSFQ